MGYVIAAYVIVLGSLLCYGLRVQAQRRALPRSSGDDEPPPR
jgi:hypothetical protein